MCWFIQSTSPVKIVVQVCHVVKYAQEENGGQNEDGHVRHLLGHEVGVYAVQTFSVLPQKYRDFVGEQLLEGSGLL
jgi:hypothetical protein